MARQHMWKMRMMKGEVWIEVRTCSYWTISLQGGFLGITCGYSQLAGITVGHQGLFLGLNDRNSCTPCFPWLVSHLSMRVGRTVHISAPEVIRKFNIKHNCILYLFSNLFYSNIHSASCTIAEGSCRPANRATLILPYSSHIQTYVISSSNSEFLALRTTWRWYLPASILHPWRISFSTPILSRLNMDVDTPGWAGFLS